MKHGVWAGGTQVPAGLSPATARPRPAGTAPAADGAQPLEATGAVPRKTAGGMSQSQRLRSSQR